MMDIISFHNSDEERNNLEQIRQKASQRFAGYVAAYDPTDPKIALKIAHTYRVATLCEEIGSSIGLEGEDLLIAWMCGLLHDIGRFEQIRRFNTFIDAESIDHALLSVQVLFGESGIIREFWEDDSYDDILETAIHHHSAYRIPENLSPRVQMYCNILRDADKVDIFRVNVETPPEEIYNTTKEQLRTAEVTPEVYEAFCEKHAVLRSLKKTPVDHLVGHASLFYELVYPKSREIAIRQGYLMKILNFKSDNPQTKKTFAQMRKTIEADTFEMR